MLGPLRSKDRRISSAVKETTTMEGSDQSMAEDEISEA
jgi:hypothetical protein